MSSILFMVSERCNLIMMRKACVICVILSDFIFLDIGSLVQVGIELKVFFQPPK